ncbi:DUF5753 domain-containing protein [Streptomyces sp. NPDC127098]|uniref:DUF5753 domain-containing protein n=1 Tax=Streptomyces sp. NPDC127098 TaxID=3347137 RepID=UPI003666E7A7
MSAPRSGPTLALRLVAADLRARREAAGMTMAAAAGILTAHEITISRMERAITSLKPRAVERLLRAYGTEEREIDEMLAKLAAANRPGWWHDYRDLLSGDLAGVIDLESGAEIIRAYEPGLVPDLLQTPDYAHALLRTRFPHEAKSQVERRLELLAARQRAAFERPSPLRFWVLIEEAALHRRVGTTKVMEKQVEYLNGFVADRSSRIAVQVMPLTVPPHPLLTSGPAEVLRFTHVHLADRLVVRGLYREAVTVTDDINAIRTYMKAFDDSCLSAPLPTTPIAMRSIPA